MLLVVLSVLLVAMVAYIYLPAICPPGFFGEEDDVAEDNVADG